MESIIIKLRLFALLFASVYFSVEDALAEARRFSAEVTISGKDMSLDIKSYWQVRQLIAKNVANGVIDAFTVYGYSQDGGFSGCVESRPVTNTTYQAFENFIDGLAEIHPQSGVFKYQRVNSCRPLELKERKMLGFAKTQPNLRAVVVVQLLARRPFPYKCSTDNSAGAAICVKYKLNGTYVAEYDGVCPRNPTRNNCP